MTGLGTAFAFIAVVLLAFTVPPVRRIITDAQIVEMLPGAEVVYLVVVRHFFAFRWVTTFYRRAGNNAVFYYLHTNEPTEGYTAKVLRRLEVAFITDPKNRTKLATLSNWIIK